MLMLLRALLLPGLNNGAGLGVIKKKLIRQQHVGLKSGGNALGNKIA